MTRHKQIRKIPRYPDSKASVSALVAFQLELYAPEEKAMVFRDLGFSEASRVPGGVASSLAHTLKNLQIVSISVCVF